MIVSVSSQASQNGSQNGEESGSKPSFPGSSGKVTALQPRAAFRRISAAATLGVVEPRDLTGDQPVGIRARPHLDVPVVPGLDRGERKLLVREALEADSGEADERGEVQRRVDAIDVHVGDPFVHVVGASTDHFEPRRLDEDAVLLLPGDSVDRDLRQHGAVEHPGVIAIGRLHHAGRAVGELRRHTSFEHVGWLNQVIVDRDDRVPPGPTSRTVTDLRNP